MNDLPIPRTFVTSMVATYTQAVQYVEQACALLSKAQDALIELGGTQSRTQIDLTQAIRDKRCDPCDPTDLKKYIRTKAWHTLVDRLEIKRVCTPSRAAEIDTLLASDEMGEITEERCIQIMQGLAENAGSFLREAAHEVFEWLTPQRSGYVTNDPELIGDRVVITYGCERAWGRSGGSQCHYNGRVRFNALDNLMHLLDGKGTIHNYNGPLIEAMNNLPFGTLAETPYFAIRCHRNGNVHLRFKRADLLARLNEMALATYHQRRMAAAQA